MKKNKFSDVDFARDYGDTSLTLNELEKIYGVHKSTFPRWAKKLGIKLRKSGRPSTLVKKK